MADTDDLSPAEHVAMAQAHHEAATANIQAAGEHVKAALPDVPPAPVSPSTVKAFPGSAQSRRPAAGSVNAKTAKAMRPKS